MSTHKYMDKICCLALLLALVVTGVFLNAPSLGIQAASTTQGYESRLFDTSRVHTIDIVMDDWEGFLEGCTDEEYELCSVVIDNESYNNVAIRAKGNTSLTQVASYGNDRYSFKIEFDHYDSTISYHGLDKLSLNNIIQDNTYMKDYLTYQMMGYFGVDAHLCSYVYITVNGEDWGLYLAVEGVEESFLERNYGSDYGELYKPDSMSMGGGRGNGGEFDLEDWMDDQSGEESQNTLPDRQAMKGQRPDGMTPPDTGEEVQSDTETMPQDMPGAVPSQDDASDSQTTDPAQTDKQFGGRGGGMECIILSVKEAYMDAQEVMHMTDYSKITALYSRLSVGDEDRDGGESNSIQNQKIFLENYARGQHLTNIRHYIDDDESGRFFDRSAYSRMMDDVENGKIGVCIMKDLTRWGRDYLQVGNAMEIFRRNNVRFIAVNNGIDSEKPDTLEFAPFINIMSEWYAKDISKKVKTGIKTKGMSGKPIATEAPYGYVKSPDNKDFWIIDEEAAGVVRLIFRLFLDGKNRNQIAVYLTQAQIPTPTFYMKERGRGTCKNRALNEANRYKWNKATLTHILTRQEYCGDVVNFKTTKHFRDKRNHYVDRSQWQITENVHEPIIDRTDFETVQRILENAPVKRPNGDGEIHPLSGLLFCKDCGAKMHIRIDYRNGGKRHVAYCSEYHKGKAKNPKCNSPHIIDADLLMQTIAEVLKKIEDYSISNWAEFEALVKKNLAMQQTDKTKKQQKRIPQITTRLEQIDKVLNKLYEDNALGTIPQDRYEQMSQKYSEEYYALKAELAELQEQLSAFENAGGRAQKFLKLTERYAAFTDLTPAILNEFISRIEVHERDKKRAKQAIQHIGIYFNYIGKFENEVTQLTEPTEQEIRQMREEIEEAKKEKSRAYHRQYSREYRARNLEKQREYDRIKAREYRARRKAQTAAAQPAQ